MEKLSLIDVNKPIKIKDSINELIEYKNTAGIIETDKLQSQINDLNSRVSDAESLAKGANQCVTYDNYEAFIEDFNSLSNDIYKAGQDIRIVTVEVPDLWVAYVDTESVEYSYTSDEDLVNELEGSGFIQVGYYKLGVLEGQKADLTNCIKNTDYATYTIPGIMRPTSGLTITDSDGGVGISKASSSQIDAKNDNYCPIVPGNFDYATSTTFLKGENAPTSETVAVFVGQLYLDTLNNKTYQCVAVDTETPNYTWEQIIKSTDYATTEKGGLIKVGAGLESVNNALQIQYAKESQIEAKSGYRNPLAPQFIDLITKVGLTTNTLEWTDEEKTNATNLLGAVKQVEYSKTQTITDGSDGGAIGRAYIRFRDNTENSIVLNAQNVKYTVPYRDAAGNFYVGTPTQTYHCTTKGYVDEVRLVAEGKTKSFTIKTLADLGTLLGFDSSVIADEYTITNTTITYKEQSVELKQGDLFLIVDTNVPDFWISVDDMKIYKMETTKVDLTDYAKSEQLDNKVDKVTTEGTLRVYGIGGSGEQQTFSVITNSNNANISRIPRYQDSSLSTTMGDDKAVLTTGTPKEDHHCAPKKYVDDMKTEIEMEYEDDITALNTRVTTLETSTPEVDTTEIENNITSLDAKVTAIENDIVSISDSKATCYKGEGEPSYYFTLNGGDESVAIGDFYFDTTNRIFYYCNNITISTSGDGNVPAWIKMSPTFEYDETTKTLNIVTE